MHQRRVASVPDGGVRANRHTQHWRAGGQRRECVLLRHWVRVKILLRLLLLVMMMMLLLVKMMLLLVMMLGLVVMWLLLLLLVMRIHHGRRQASSGTQLRVTGGWRQLRRARRQEIRGSR